MKLSSLKKEIEQNIVLLSSDEEKLSSFIERIRTEWDNITTEAPLISQKTFERNFRKYRGENHFPILLQTDESTKS